MGKTSKIRQAKERQAVKKAAKHFQKYVASMPKVAQDDLLAFQLTHFGDDSQPDQWFVDPETATNLEVQQDDGLGYYDDGTKRTLTDAQIAMFRRTELWQMQRSQQLQKEEEQESCNPQVPEQAERVGKADAVEGRAQSPASDASSLENDLLAFVSPATATATTRPKNHPQSARRRSQNSRSDTTSSTSTGSWKKQRLSKEVPYDQRHKRKWEKYIKDTDPVEGSRTVRRIARELDDQQAESVEMDY